MESPSTPAHILTTPGWTTLLSQQGAHFLLEEHLRDLSPPSELQTHSKSPQMEAYLNEKTFDIVKQKLLELHLKGVLLEEQPL